MRVLYFILKFGNTPFVTSQIEQIAEDNNVCVICQSNDLKGSQLSIEEVPISEPDFVWNLRNRFEISDIFFNYYNPFWAKSLKSKLQDFKPDVLHIQFGYDAVILLQNYFPRKIPIVITFRGYDASLKLILKSYKKQLTKILSKPNVFPVFVSESLKNNLIMSGIKINPIHEVIYSNTDTEFFKRKSESHHRDVLRFTQVSNYREKKGHFYTIKAFEKIVGQVEFRLTFVGKKDRDFKNLIQDISSSAIYDRIEFIDGLDKAGVRDVLEKSHYFIHNSITSKFNDQEGIPNAVMEAMAMELPILTTYHAGIPELDNGKVDIFYSKEKDIHEYAMNILKAVEFKNYSYRNRKRIIDGFSKMRFGNQLSEFYDKTSKHFCD